MLRGRERGEVRRDSRPCREAVGGADQRRGDHERPRDRDHGEDEHGSRTDVARLVAPATASTRHVSNRQVSNRRVSTRRASTFPHRSRSAHGSAHGSAHAVAAARARIPSDHPVNGALTVTVTQPSARCTAT